MSYKNDTTRKKEYKQLTRIDRDTIERHLLAGSSQAHIAKQLNVSPSTVSREIDRGSFIRRRRNPKISKDPVVPEYIDEKVYEAEEAQRRYDSNKKKCGAKNTMLQHKELIEFIEKKFFSKKKWSLDAARGEAELLQKFKGEIVCIATLYRWVDSGLLRVKNRHLPLKLKRGQNSKKQDKKKELGKRIDQRPKEVDSREEFGHWEGDGIVGADHKGHLISLVERKTGQGFLFSVGDSEGSHMVEILNILHKQFGKHFSEIFKTITFDNGPEGSDCEGLEKDGRTLIYYCHPYSSYERGTNEQWNGMVRRFFPKGTKFDKISNEDTARIANYINTLPRKRFKYRTPLYMFKQEVKKIMAA